MIGTPNSTFALQNQNTGRVLHHETFSDEGYTNNLSLTQARMTRPDSLNPVITHLMGQESKKFPLLFLTEGQNKGVKYVEIQDVEYEWPVFGRLRTTDAVAGHDYTVGDKPGFGGLPLYVTFKTAWLKYQHNVVSPNGTTCRILIKPEKVSTGYKYTLEIVSNSRNSYVNLSELTPNTLWSMTGGANVAESYSVGNESNKQMPGKLKNQIGILRKSYEIAGNVPNRTVTFNLPTKGGGSENYWLAFEEWQHEITFKQACEESLWESIYNKDIYGNIMNIDPESQLPIPYAAGLKEQIPNRDTYGKLTLKKLKKVVSEVTYGATDSDQMNIVLFTGMGGKEEFSDAIMEEASGWALYQGALNNTVTGSPMGLTFGSAFVSYRHIDGHMITIAHLPYLDFGGRAANSPLHPISGKPLTSYEMHFVDMSVYDGENNVQLVSQKGRSLIRGIEQGMTTLKNLNYGNYGGNQMDIKLSTSQDKSSIHYLKTLGVAVRRNTHCFSLYCNAD
jgi:hypothetical protein